MQSVTDLGQRWRTLMGDLGFGERLIWFSFLDSDRHMIKVLHQMAIPREPKRRLCAELLHLAVRGARRADPIRA